MPLKTIAIAVALLALASALALCVAVVRGFRRHRGRARWVRAVLAVPALCLLGLVVVLLPYIFGLNAPHAIFTAPAPVPDGASVYTSVGTALDIRGTSLVAINARTGHTRWLGAPAPQHTLCTQDGAVLYAATGDQRGTTLSARNGATGALVWSDQLPNVLPEPNTSVVVADDVLVMVLYDSVGEHVGLQSLYAFRLADGHRLWQVVISSQPTGPIQVVGGAGVVFVHPFVGSMSARSLADGHLMWSAAAFDGQIVAGGNVVFELTRAGDMLALGAQTGAVLWRSTVPGDLRAGVVGQSALYVTAQPDTVNASQILIDPVTVYAVNLASGALLWQFATKSVDAGTLLASSQGVFVAVDDGLYALRPSDGELLWHNVMSGWRVISGLSPFVGAVLYLSRIESVPPQQLVQLAQYGQTFLYAFDQTTGATYWKMPIGPLVTTHGILVF